MFFNRYSSWIIGISVFVLCTLGLIMLTSTSIWSRESGGESYSHVVNQAKWLLIGLAAACGLAAMDYRKLQRYWKQILAFACFLLVLCYVPGIGVEVNGETRWIRVPGLRQFQPSECAKIALTIALAAYIAKFQAEIRTFKNGFVVPSILLGIPVALIFFEKDMGTAVSLGAAGGCVLFVAGTRLRYLLTGGIGALGALAYVVMQSPNRMRRILSFRDLEASKLEEGLQQFRAMLAFANGGVNGLGLGNGAEKHDRLPFAHTDFIFAMVGEELGLYWTLGTVFCFLLIVMAGICIAVHAKDMFGKLFATGLVAIIVMPAMLNIAVVTALLPNTGLPLPFLSYGGTNLVFTLAAIGLLISIHRHTVQVDVSEMPLIKERKLAIRI